jgi:single-strand DNA-binding protein
VNSVSITGRWGKDVELRYTPSGRAVINADLAVKDGKDTDWIPVVIWEKQAELVANHCGTAGRLIGITGRLKTRTYEDSAGKKRKVMEVVASQVDFLDSGKSEAGGQQSRGMGSELTFDPNDDVPFDPMFL